MLKKKIAKYVWNWTDKPGNKLMSKCIGGGGGKCVSGRPPAKFKCKYMFLAEKIHKYLLENTCILLVFSKIN